MTEKVPPLITSADEGLASEMVTETLSQALVTQAVAGAAGADANANANAIAVTAAQLPGELLMARRQQLRWSVEEAASRVKLAPRQISALEANDFAALPGMASVRGFVRSYAKALELDPAPLLNMIATESNPVLGADVLRRPLPSQRLPGRRYAPASRHRHGARRLSTYAVLALVFLVGLGYAGFHHGLVSIPKVASIDLSFSWPAATPEDEIAAPVLQPPVASEPAAESAANVALIDPSRLLELRMREDAWVEVSTVAGTKLVSRLMKAGTTEQFEITEPLVLVVGNAAGVDASLRGQPLNLRSVARDNVSKLNLK